MWGRDTVVRPASVNGRKAREIFLLFRLGGYIKAEKAKRFDCLAVDRQMRPAEPTAQSTTQDSPGSEDGARQSRIRQAEMQGNLW